MCVEVVDTTKLIGLCRGRGLRQSAFGPDGSRTRSVLGTMLAEEVWTFSMRRGPARFADRYDPREKRRIP